MLDERGFIIKKKGVAERLAPAARASLKQPEIMSDEELQALPVGSLFVFDVETYSNFFFVAFKSIDNGKIVTFERSPDYNFNETKLLWMLWRFCIVGFNSRSYDIPIILYACKGATNAELKQASDFIIVENNTPFNFEKVYKTQPAKFNHIDLINVAPLMGSLKLYAGRLHTKRMQDLPFDPHAILTKEDAETIRLYCCNDLDNTQLLFKELASEIKLRTEMSQEYGVDLRSKSDAQVAEAVINTELEKVLGYYPKKPTIPEGTILQYNLPPFIEYQTPELRAALTVVLTARFELDAIGAPIMPKALEKLTVRLGKSSYTLGMGGLHSNEKKACYVAAANTVLADNDVESYYPRIILNQRLYPTHLGEAFLKVYESIVTRRIHAKKEAVIAKKAGNKEDARRYKIIADSLKITINGSFGKLGNKYSTLYAPQLMLQVTITGQLALLMLIEMMEGIGIEVISGNTDGIILNYDKSRHEEVRNVIANWENKTQFKTEETRYSAVYSRDVNSYIALKEEGGEEGARFLDERLGCKTKGVFSERGSALNSILSKNPETLVCIDAVLQFIKNRIPVETTVKACTDIRRFVSVKNVKGGGQKNGVYLGKVVRWYYAKNEPGYISYVGTGNKVGKTDGAKPLMDLPNELPNDIDYEWYIKEAIEMLYDLGYYKVAKTGTLFD